jgi:3-polyprenyl-4-hydroxybenzoate decarboxylase
MLPNLCIDLLDPSADPAGISHRMIIDATTPVWPDKRGSFGQQLDSPQRTDEWRKKLSAMLKELRK